MKPMWWKYMMGLAGMIAGTSLAGIPAQTGTEFRHKPTPAGGREMVYYIVDWGDGTLTATAHGFATASPFVRKIWSTPGTFTIKPAAITMSGRAIPLKTQSVTVSGPPIQEVLLEAQPLAPATLNKEHPRAPQSIGLRFARHCALDGVILEKQADSPFPKNFRIEFSTDGGEVWNDVPSAIFAHFPDPGKSKVLIPLNGIAANALRVISYSPPTATVTPYTLRLGRPQVVGRTDLLFDMDTDPVKVADWNNMWLVYGSAANEIHHTFTPWRPTDRPDAGGLLAIGSTIWAHWNSMKISWLGDTAARTNYESIVNLYPQDERGLMGVAPNSFLHLGHSKHYVTPALFISGLSHWYLMHRDRAFLEKTSPQATGTLLERMRKAMRYQLEDLEGRSGVLTIRDPEHDGTVKGLSGNYWDGWRFGFQSAYENTLFYESLKWMARLEQALGNPQQAEEYIALRALVKQKYNEVFWDGHKGRFIGAMDVQGNRHDYGFTFVNTEAVAAGLATPEHAEKIFEWLDGRRVVEGDTSTGADIYHFKVAPRANTLAAEAIRPSWWDNWTMEVGPGTMGEYGMQIQNGGHIFYVSHYDLMGRLRTRNVEDALRRMRVILDEFHQDQLRRTPCNRLGSTHLGGIVREFPESGLVPLFFITGIMGLEPEAEGLRIAPSLPAAWRFAGVRKYVFAGREYCIRADRHHTQPSTSGNRIIVPATGQWMLKPNGVLMPWN